MHDQCSILDYAPLKIPPESFCSEESDEKLSKSKNDSAGEIWLFSISGEGGWFRF